MQYFGFDRPSFAFKTFGFGSSEFSPLDLFAGGKQGVWYDPSDKTTLFQDVEGTVPVTKDGDPVALMRDKSGNGNYATQTLSASRPIYRTDGILHWLEFDGTDDSMRVDRGVSTARDFTYIDIAMRTSSGAGYEFYLYNNSPRFGFFSNNAGLTVSRAAGIELRTGNIPILSNIIGSLDLNPTNTSFRLNNGVAMVGNAGLANLQGFTVGANENRTTFVKMRVYGLIIVGLTTASTEQAIISTRSYLATKSGVTL